MAPAKIIDMLQKDLADELAAITQYMYHHVMMTGPEAVSISSLFKKTAIDEMGHAERLAERITELGGVPTAKPAEIKVGGDWRTMVSDDLAGEVEALRTYGEHMAAVGQTDPVTRRLLEDLLLDEHRHAEQWKSILER